MATLEEAKQFLKQDKNGKGTNLYDHLSDVLLKILVEKKILGWSVLKIALIEWQIFYSNIWWNLVFMYRKQLDIVHEIFSRKS